MRKLSARLRKKMSAAVCNWRRRRQCASSVCLKIELIPLLSLSLLPVTATGRRHHLITPDSFRHVIQSSQSSQSSQSPVIHTSIFFNLPHSLTYSLTILLYYYTTTSSSQNSLYVYDQVFMKIVSGVDLIILYEFYIQMIEEFW